MAYYYEKLFKISIKHDAYPAGISKEDFVIQPTLECAQLLKQLNWIYKPIENGALVIVEKIERNPGVKEPLRKLRNKEAFSFSVSIKPNSILHQMKPFDQVAAFELPSGESVKLYYDNLINNLISPQVELSTTGETGLEDLATFFPNKFVWRKNNTDTARLFIDEIAQGGGYANDYSFAGTITKASIELEDGAYLFTERNSLNGKLADYILQVNTRMAKGKAIGIIRIYKDELTDYSAAAAIDYEITMKKIV